MAEGDSDSQYSFQLKAVIEEDHEEEQEIVEGKLNFIILQN